MTPPEAAFEIPTKPPWLVCDRRLHGYFINGDPVPSVTGVIRDARLSDYHGMTQDGRRDTREFGTIFHALCHEADTGLKVLSPALEAVYTENPWALDDRLAKYIEWERESGVEILASELPVGNEAFLYGGTLDKVVKLEGQYGIIDIKSGPERPWDLVQVAGYGLCVPGAPNRWVLSVPARGKAKLHKSENPRRDERVFLSALSVVHEQLAYGLTSDMWEMEDR